jgi:hypothetical protein
MTSRHLLLSSKTLRAVAFGALIVRGAVLPRGLGSRNSGVGSDIRIFRLLKCSNVRPQLFIASFYPG